MPTFHADVAAICLWGALLAECLSFFSWQYSSKSKGWNTVFPDRKKFPWTRAIIFKGTLHMTTLISPKFQMLIVPLGFHIFLVHKCINLIFFPQAFQSKQHLWCSIHRSTEIEENVKPWQSHYIIIEFPTN